MLADLCCQWLSGNRRALGGRTGRDRRRLCLETLEDRTAPATLNLNPIADNTLIQFSSANPSQQLSNGVGQHFYAGRTNQGSNDIRRGAVKFDLSGVPAGSTITSVTLTLHMSKTRSAAQSIGLHRALANWGEGTSNGALGGHGGEGAGVQATSGDLTWFYNIFSTQQWTTPGGDFTAAASATTSVNNVGTYTWSGAGLIADVQQWLSNPTTNFGWIITGNEARGDTAKEFDTREDRTASGRP